MASIEDGIEAAAAAAQERDVVITLGAGNISQAGPKLLEKLAARTRGVRATSGAES
jgi:UDP-N-acetylmuramate--alanine ligase